MYIHTFMLINMLQNKSVKNLLFDARSGMMLLCIFSSTCSNGAILYSTEARCSSRLIINISPAEKVLPCILCEAVRVSVPLQKVRGDQ